jgi:hypothetical protein
MIVDLKGLRTWIKPIDFFSKFDYYWYVSLQFCLNISTYRDRFSYIIRILNLFHPYQNSDKRNQRTLRSVYLYMQDVCT